MTEAEWLACDHPAAMLIYLRGEVSAQERSESRASLHGGAGTLYPGPSPIVPAERFTYFVAACAARLRRLPFDEQVHRYLDTFQRHIDGQASPEELRESYSAMDAARQVAGQRSYVDDLFLGAAIDPYGAAAVCWRLEGAVAWTVARDAIAITCAGASEDDWFEWAFSGGPPDPLYQDTQKAEGREQANLLREVMGNPFRPVFADPAWVTQNVLGLAQATYDARTLPTGNLDPDRLAVLADALEDAGCTDSTILEHLRGPGPHVRGC
jgi:hypothetical protein